MTSKRNTFSAVITGLGGQGILLISRIIAAAACKTHEFICRTESRGLSQRGGSVCSEVRFGALSMAPVIARGGADLILALDALEGTRVLDFLRPGGAIVTTDGFIPPFHLLSAWKFENREQQKHAELSARLNGILRLQDNLRIVESSGLPDAVRRGRSQNLLLLGASSRCLPIPLQDLREALEMLIKPNQKDEALFAFDSGVTMTLINDANCIGSGAK